RGAIRHRQLARVGGARRRCRPIAALTSRRRIMSPNPERAPADAPPPPALAAPDPRPQAASAPRGSRRPLVMAILGLIALVALGLAVRHFLWARTHVRTDNAQVEGSVVPVLAKVSGFVTQVGVRENQPVRAGDLLVRLDDREYEAKRAQNEADL